MTEYDATEQAYKRGYEQAVKDFTERVKEKLHLAPTVYQSYFLRKIDETVKEMEGDR
jgi:hypothetical protein